jgi:hypothetical protein
LSRDARILVDGGYRIVRVCPVDQFLFDHVEAVATISEDGRQRPIKNDTASVMPGLLMADQS